MNYETSGCDWRDMFELKRVTRIRISAKIAISYEPTKKHLIVYINTNTWIIPIQSKPYYIIIIDTLIITIGQPDASKRKVNGKPKVRR